MQQLPIAQSNGPWTPVLEFDGNAAGNTYLMQSGHYWRVGSLVHVEFGIYLTNKGTNVGAARLSALPLPCSGTLKHGGIAIQFAGFAPSLSVPIAFQTVVDGTVLELIRLQNGAGAVMASDFTDQSFIYGSCTYPTNAP